MKNNECTYYSRPRSYMNNCLAVCLDERYACNVCTCICICICICVCVFVCVPALRIHISEEVISKVWPLSTIKHI